jgi:hypothetical protein
MFITCLEGKEFIVCMFIEHNMSFGIKDPLRPIEHVQFQKLKL